MTYLSDALDRITAMEKEVIPGSDAVKVFIYAQESFPYWTNRVGAFQIVLDSQDLQVITFQILMRLVIGHMTEGYTGELEETLQTTYIPQILTYFAQHVGLQCLSFPGQMQYLDPRGVMILNGTGLAVFQQGGIGSNQIGAEFSLEVPIKEFIVQAY